MQDRIWWTLYALAWVVIVVLWFAAPIVLWQIELAFRAGLTIVALVMIIVWAIYRREHVPSMILN